MSRRPISEDTRAAWGSRSLVWTLGGTVFLLVTGLVILLAPFGEGAQATVLAHTVLGLAFLWPCLAYGVPHVRRRWKDPLSHFLILGYASGVLLLAVLVSGLVLTVQAAFGRRIDYGWDLVHTVAGCAVPVLLGFHLATAVRRNRPGEASFVLRLCGGTFAAGLVASVLAFGAGEIVRVAEPRRPLPAGYSLRYGENPFAPSLARTDWLARLEQDHRWIGFLESLGDESSAEKVDEFLRGAEAALEADRASRDRGEHFVDELGGLEVDTGRVAALGAIASAADPAPLVRTLLAEVKRDLEGHSARFREASAIAPEALSGSHSCGTTGCHEEILAEWEPSAHRYSSRSKFFQLIQGAMAEANGAESTRYCAGCHDPIALFSGAKNIYGPEDDLTSPGADEGVSCVACHRLVRTDVQGNANYILAPGRPYLAQDSFVGRFLIRAYPRHHKTSFQRPLQPTAEFCGACHKQFIDQELNRATRVQLQNQYDAWKGSHWFVPDPENAARADPERSLVCRDCHMRLVSDSREPASEDGKHRHHGFIAANQWLPLLHDLPHAKEHVRLTEQWLRGETVLPEIADRWPFGPPVPIEIEAPERVRPGDAVKVRVLLDNRKVGHTFPTGPLDVIQSWVDVRVTQDGEEIFRSGALDEDGFIREGAFTLKAEGVDRAGNLIDRHNLWDMVGARFRRVLYPGYSDFQEYTFDCICEDDSPVAGTETEFRARKAGELVVTATLRYRKVDQTLLNVLVPDGTARAPVTDMSTATARIRVEEEP